jgi:hypothetical protein
MSGAKTAAGALILAAVVGAVGVVSTRDGSLDDRIKACEAGGSCVISLGEADIRLERPLRLCPGISIHGEGPDHTIIRAATSTNGIEVLPFERCRSEGRRVIGRVALEGFRLVGSPPGEQPTRGIAAANHVRIRDVVVDRFAIGIEIAAYVSQGGNANGWQMQDVYAQRAEHAGVWVRGSDANAGAWIGGGASSNCQRASKWAALLATEPLPCAGVIERSFLGNTLVGIATASNVELKEGCTTLVPSCIQTKFPGFDFTGLSQRSVCLGCYTESDQATSIISPWSAAVGGLSRWEGTGLWVEGRRVRSLEVVNGLDPSNTTIIKFGAATNYPGAFMDWSSNALGLGNLRLISDAANKEYRFNIANIPYPIRIIGSHGMAAGSLGTLRLHWNLLKIDGTPPATFP